MSRRELLVTMVQALLLALFPWLRSEHGVVQAGSVADLLVPGSLQSDLLVSGVFFHIEMEPI